MRRSSPATSVTTRPSRTPKSDWEAQATEGLNSDQSETSESSPSPGRSSGLPSTVTRSRSTPGSWDRVQASCANTSDSCSSSRSSTSSLSGTSAVPSCESGTEMSSSRVRAGTNVRSTPSRSRPGPSSRPLTSDVGACAPVGT